MFVKFFDLVIILTNLFFLIYFHKYVRIGTIFQTRKFHAFCVYFVYFIIIDCLLLPMACVSGYQRESSATEDSENDDKVNYAFSVCLHEIIFVKYL